MNAKTILGRVGLAFFVALFLTAILSIEVTALGPSGKCYVSCTGGGIPFHLYEHNLCVSACMLGENIHGPGGGSSLEPLLPVNRPIQPPSGQIQQRR
jgi:hypothetical protein